MKRVRISSVKDYLDSNRSLCYSGFARRVSHLTRLCAGVDAEARGHNQCSLYIITGNRSDRLFSNKTDCVTRLGILTCCRTSAALLCVPSAISYTILDTAMHTITFEDSSSPAVSRFNLEFGHRGDMESSISWHGLTAYWVGSYQFECRARRAPAIASIPRGSAIARLLVATG